MRSRSTIVSASILLVAIGGGCCGPNTALEARGKIYYLDGAGNWGFGTSSVRKGFENAGFAGDVEVFRWSSTLNPLWDQLDVAQAKRSGQILAKRIRAYRERYPGSPVHIVALSAGTGVAVWACEGLGPDCRVDSLVLLGSSLSHDYDIRSASTNIRRPIYVYHSSKDAVLRLVEGIGTIDRKIGTKSAGQIGLRPQHGHARIVNVEWTPRYDQLGWHGGHTDCTSECFVRTEIAPRILSMTALASSGDYRRAPARTGSVRYAHDVD